MRSSSRSDDEDEDDNYDEDEDNDDGDDYHGDRAYSDDDHGKSEGKSNILDNQQIERIIEIGSGKVLCGLISKTCPQIEALSLQNSQDVANFLTTL